MTDAQSAVRALSPSTSGADVTVVLAGGTYRLSSTWAFGSTDSGSAGHPVVWRAAPGARPVISGASQVTDWSRVGSSDVWSAPVPAGSATRQLYVNGQKAPVAQAGTASLGFTGSWPTSATGYDISGDSNASAWFAALPPAQVAGVEFTYPAGNGAWTHSRCRVAGYANGTLTMTQPCWSNVTARAKYSQASGDLPSMTPNTKPTVIENAQALVRPGQWFLDASGSRLYYQPTAGQSVNDLDIELPRLESLLQGAGTLSAPLHDMTFQGLQFSHATWNAPSGPEGFADVQGNLRMTGATNQGMCHFSTPYGSCPWGALSQPLANVAFTAVTNVTLTGNRFTGLGGAGLSVMYGSKNTLISGNEFTDIASTGLALGCTYDPNPTNSNPAIDPDEPSVIKEKCTPNAAQVSGDTIGTNEILTDTTVSDNVIHDVGTDYNSATGITLLFSRGTKIVHNNLYDLPYTAITGGVIQGHVDNAGHPQNSININENNTISNNLIHDYMSTLKDGGAIYLEGHQAQYYDAAGNPTTYDRADPVKTLAHGMQVQGNVAFNGGNTNFTYYDDAGSEWINWQGNVAFSAGEKSGGCSATGHIWVTDNYLSARHSAYECDPAIDTHASGNISIPATPKPGDLPAGLLTNAGVTPAHAALVAGIGPRVHYFSPATGSNQVLIGGEGFTPGTQIYAGSTRLAASDVQVLSSGFITATVPAGTPASQISVSNRLDDTDPSIAYSGFSLHGNRGFGDLGDDIHYATADGSTATYSFSG
ncbi:right-handed parallel beta-helix repeat-containing protein, partial [Kitasatospora sp. NPDC098652]|uniref:right-handed parallel beta-helix repeat-containing protein n=1 Tax=Kitasatospora sp. NPDC098652 TaxID=3364095 RepID=UPI003820A35D